MRPGRRAALAAGVGVLTLMNPGHRNARGEVDETGDEELPRLIRTVIAEGIEGRNVSPARGSKLHEG